MDNNLKPIIGVSACLTGESVRYDGGHKLQPQLQRFLQPFVGVIPVCPEVSAGFGVPRPTIQLWQQNQGIRALVNQQRGPDEDVSDKLTKVADSFLNEHAQLPLCGFVFKSRSPSCGLTSTPVQNGAGNLSSGLFADRIQTWQQALVLVEETWLVNAARHYRFLSACFLLFYHYHGGLVDPDLLRALHFDTAQIANQALIDEHVKNLLSEDAKAAVEQRLCQYWERCLTEAG